MSIFPDCSVFSDPRKSRGVGSVWLCSYLVVHRARSRSLNVHPSLGFKPVGLRGGFRSYTTWPSQLSTYDRHFEETQRSTELILENEADVSVRCGQARKLSKLRVSVSPITETNNCGAGSMSDLVLLQRRGRRFRITVERASIPKTM